MSLYWGEAATDDMDALPSGWTEIDRIDVDDYHQVVGWALGSVASLSVTRAGSGSKTISSVVHRVSGRDTSTPVASFASELAAHVFNTVVAPALTLGAGEDGFWFWGSRGNGTWTTDGPTTDLGQPLIDTSASTVCAAYKSNPGAGAYGAYTRAGPLFQSGKMGFAVALAAAPAGGFTGGELSTMSGGMNPMTGGMSE